jgi:patatin-like phospholipase/acyl hydrolase
MGYEVKTTDEVVIRAIKKIDERSLIGQEKYGDTMMSEVNSGKKDLSRFLIDVQEEMTDSLLYLEAARSCLQDEIEEAMMSRMNVIGQNGNIGDHYHNDPCPIHDEEV